ncbi:unnamed protein product [Brassicogethes aeneus]|uniref:Intraflagellar transport protein 46 homolog n=1 Tax=Brassicogethes aeneus TaxID=1431903 RepID=A0A9P0B1W9_BRAAE|nr:unnamed protein product [Brassicogethes aeneus]
MQRSFSIINDDEDEQELKIEEFIRQSSDKKYSDIVSDSEENSTSPKKINQRHDEISAPSVPQPLPRHGINKDIPQSSTSKENVKSPHKVEKLAHLSSDSDADDDDKKIVPGQYDPKEFENLNVDVEIQEIFQYITKYIPQILNLDHKFKPFIPEFLPAVGDIDAFLKVIPPHQNLNGDIFEDHLKLGLEVLDEPAASQSDPALLQLQLRASSIKASDKNLNVVVKKIDKVEKNTKTIDKWIKDISDLHKSKSSPVVRYSEPMPDLDDLMQEWPEEMETHLLEHGFPKPESDAKLSDYITLVCNTFNIPVKKNKVQSLHFLFSLYAAVKTSQLFQAAKTEIKNKIGEKKEEANQLVLDYN